MRLSGSLQKSTDVMKSMNNLMKVPEIRQTMMEMSKEMMKASLPLEFNVRLLSVFLLGWNYGRDDGRHV